MEISVGLGEPFDLFISLNIKKVEFGFVFNKEELDKFQVSVPFADINEVKIEGDIEVNYLGFTNLGMH